MSSIPGVIYLL